MTRPIFVPDGVTPTPELVERWKRQDFTGHLRSHEEIVAALCEEQYRGSLTLMKAELEELGKTRGRHLSHQNRIRGDIAIVNELLARGKVTGLKS